MRGRRLTAILAAGLLALVATGCGSDDSLAPEVPGPPADVAVPEATVEASANEDGAAAEEDAAAGDATTEDGAAAPDEVAPTEEPGAAAPEESGGGTTAPEAEPDGPTNDTAPPAGSEAEQFEDFCAQNPGAC